MTQEAKSAEQQQKADVKAAKRKFVLHTMLIEELEGLGKTEAQAKAYLEGPAGLARRSAK